MFLGLLCFVPGLIELLRARDPGPLSVDLDRDIDERYFSRAFRQYLNRALALTPIKSSGTEEIAVSMNRGLERLKVVNEDLHLASETHYKHSLLIRGNLTTENNCRLEGEICVEQTCITGKNNNILALYGREVHLGENNIVKGWVDAEEILEIEPNCTIGSRVTAGQRISLKGDADLKALAAPVIVIGDDIEPTRPFEDRLAPPQWSADLDRLVITNFDTQTIEEIGAYIERSVGKSIPYSNVLRRANQLGLIEKPLILLNEKQRPHFIKDKTWLQAGDTIRVKGDVNIPTGERIAGNLIVEGNLSTEPAVAFEGGVHVNGSVDLGAGAVLAKSLVARGNITLNEGCIIEQCCDADGDLYVKSGTRVGNSGTGGLSSRKTVFIERNTLIKGKIYGENAVKTAQKI